MLTSRRIRLPIRGAACWQLTALFRARFPFKEQLHFCSLWKKQTTWSEAPYKSGSEDRSGFGRCQAHAAPGVCALQRCPPQPSWPKSQAPRLRPKGGLFQALGQLVPWGCRGAASKDLQPLSPLPSPSPSQPSPPLPSPALPLPALSALPPTPPPPPLPITDSMFPHEDLLLAQQEPHPQAHCSLLSEAWDRSPAWRKTHADTHVV